jgi:DNA-nicking Smr family endonuclease
VQRRPTRPKPEAKFSRAATAAIEDSPIDDGLADSGEIAFRRRGLAERNFRDLRRGRFRIEDEIDLHGLTRKQAKLSLREFIVECASRRLGCVRVIHGKGTRSGPAGPVLKPAVQRWLARWEEVLAYVSASAQDGGAGAIHVLLRSR